MQKSKSTTTHRESKDFDMHAIMSLTDVDKAWMAGFFDGEGSIGLYRKRKNGEVYAVTVRVTICQTAPDDLRCFFDAFGGAMSRIDRPDRGTTRHTAYWSWTCDSVSNARMLCMTLLPYLRGKAREAELLMEYIDNRNSHTLQQKLDIVDRLSGMKVKAA